MYLEIGIPPSHRHLHPEHGGGGCDAYGTVSAECHDVLLIGVYIVGLPAPRDRSFHQILIQALVIPAKKLLQEGTGIVYVDRPLVKKGKRVPEILHIDRLVSLFVEKDP